MKHLKNQTPWRVVVIGSNRFFASNLHYKYISNMLINKLLRILLLPLGLLIKLKELAVEGARDLHNSLRFKGSLIDRKCCINPTSKIEHSCHILENCLILNSTINSYSYVGKNAIIQNATIASFCSIANDVFIGLGAHPIENFSTSPIFYRINNPLNIKLIDVDSGFNEYQSIEIGNDVWIGARAIVMDGVKINDGAIIAAGAVVTKDIPAYAIVGGIPAKVIRYRFSPEKIEELLKLQWWAWPLNEIHKRSQELNRL